MSDQGNNIPSSLHAPASARDVSLSDRVRSLRIKDRPAAQPVGRWWLPWALCAICALAAVFFASRPRTVEVPAPEKDPLAEALAQGGDSTSTGKSGQQVAGPQKGLKSDAVLLESKGYVVPVQTIQVSPKVGGVVLKLNIKEGQYVNKDDVLAELEKVEYESQYNKLKAMTEAAHQRYLELEHGYREEEVNQAIAEHKEAQAQLTYLKSEFLRHETLWKNKSVSEKDYQQAKADYDQMLQKVDRLNWAKVWKVKGQREETKEAAKADWKQLEAETVRAKWQLDNTTVLAPISGTILTKKAEEGNLVNPAAFSVAASLCDMADLYNLEVDLSIAERDINKVFKGQKCKIRPEAYLNRFYWGTVSRLMPTADRAKSAIPVRVKVHFPFRHDVAASAVGMMATPFGGNGLLAPVGFNHLVAEKQAEFLRSDMGALVTFLNNYTEEP